VPFESVESMPHRPLHQSEVEAIRTHPNVEASVTAGDTEDTAHTLLLLFPDGRVISVQYRSDEWTKDVVDRGVDVDEFHETARELFRRM